MYSEIQEKISELFELWIVIIIIFLVRKIIMILICHRYKCLIIKKNDSQPEPVALDGPATVCKSNSFYTDAPEINLQWNI